MNQYLFYSDGLDYEAWAEGETLKEAREAFFAALAPEERMEAGRVTCIDEEPA